MPINCVNWYEAYAFCIWDGGFLPSEAEWGYAAAGGDAQLEYPWGSVSPGTQSQFAIIGCDYPSGSGACTSVGNLAPVGTAALGAGRWGQLDLMGDVVQWNIDWYASPYVDPCIDCGDFTVPRGGSRVLRGASFSASATSSPVATRDYSAPLTQSGFFGVRCARTP